MTAAGGRRFVVGFSYAGEDRPVVAPVAERLARRFGRERVLFDRFHEAELARTDLDVYLPRLYRDATDLIVVVLSPDYPRKRWCGLEWRWIRQLILNDAGQGQIMLLQIGDPGDLSDLGILSGDGYLDISRRSAEAIAAAIGQRLDQQHGSAAPPVPSGAPWFRRRRVLAALGGAAAVLVAAGLAVSRPLQARWQREQGDQAYLAFTKGSDLGQLQRAVRAWRQALDADPQQPEPHARLAFFHDFVGQPDKAERQWHQAEDLVPPDSPQGRDYRNGRANVMAQQPGRRAEALALYDADRFYPRSALEAALLRWADPRQLPQAVDAIQERELSTALAGDGPPASPWGFKANGEVLQFETRAQQRCLLAAARAVTAHLAGGPAPAAVPLASGDCQGVQGTTRDLLCQRLQQALPTNPRASASRTWLGCVPAPVIQGGEPS